MERAEGVPEEKKASRKTEGEEIYSQWAILVAKRRVRNE